MTITINGSDIDFTLEKEKTAGDVLSGISSWLEDSGMLIGSVQLDNEAVALVDTEWKTRPVDSISNFAVEAVSLREGRIRQIETARDFFVLMHKAARENDPGYLTELSESYTDLKRILPHLLSEGYGPAVMDHLDESLTRAGFPANDAVEPDMEAILSESDRMMQLLESRRKEAASPESEAMSTATALAAMAGRLDDVAVHLQTGKDRLAMETIILLTELLQTLMRSLSWAEGSDDLQSVVDDLTGILAELEDALKASDTVLIGDLLEYEIKPRLQELPGRLNFTGEGTQ